MITTVTLNPSLDEWIHVPRLRLGELNRATAFMRYPGGKGINVSRVVHELGEETVAVALSGGEDGHILSHLLKQQGIAYRSVTVRGTTRNNYQLHTDSPDALTQINCPGPQASSQTLGKLERVLRRLRSHSSCVVLSGSLPPGAPVRTYQRLIRMLNRLEALIVLDTSGPALREGVSARPWLIKPNRQEAEALLGRRLPSLARVAQAAKQLAVHGGPTVVVMSLGPEGAVLAAQTSAEVWWAKPPTVRVRSTVGAGDSLVAGFVVGWLRTRSLQEAFRLGMACGTASVMTPGTELCHRADVKRLKRRITIRPIG